MTIIVLGAAAAVSGGTVAAASGWSSPTGLAAFLVALTGAIATVWSIRQGTKKRDDIDADAAAKIIKAMRADEDEG